MTDAATTQVVSAVITREATVLLLRRAWNYPDIELGVGWWELPGGKSEAGESPFGTLQRELKEEIGLALHPSLPRDIGSCSYTLRKNNTQTHRVHAIFALVAPADWRIQLSTEHDQYAFVATKDLGRIAIPELRVFLSQQLPSCFAQSQI